MKKILWLSSIILISGCMKSTVVVDTKWPDVPVELTKPCPDLKQMDTDDSKLSSLLNTVGDNYLEYHLCKNRVEGWNNWYQDQKKIKESINK